MKRLLLLLPVFACLFFSCTSNKRTAFIKVHDLATYLDEHYDFASSDGKTYFNLAKKKTGWFVQQCESKDGNTLVLKEECCWSAETKTYLPIKIAPEGRDARKHFTSQFRTDIADRVPYYGYTSWAKDVIADFEGNNDDTTLEALARAYEHYANGFLDGRMGDCLPEQQKGSLDER
ncbi:MAG: hypothetical protein ACRCYO_04005, partial [Bacteroidia bacterium]